MAVSINLRVIFDVEKQAGGSYLTGRALESLAALLVVLGISLVGLDPSIGRVVFAVFIILCAVGSAVSPIRATRAYRSSGVKPVAFNLRLFLACLLGAVYAVSGVTLIAQASPALMARAAGRVPWLTEIAAC